MLEKYRSNFKIEERKLSNDVHIDYTSRCNQFLKFLAEAIPTANETKNSFYTIAANYDTAFQGNRKIIQQLSKYEEIAIVHYSNDDYNQRRYTHPSQDQLSGKVEELFDKQAKNPFHEAYIWAK